MCGQRPLEKEEIIAHQRAFNQLDVVFEYRPMKTSHGLIAQKLIIHYGVGKYQLKSHFHAFTNETHTKRCFTREWALPYLSHIHQRVDVHMRPSSHDGARRTL